MWCVTAPALKYRSELLSHHKPKESSEPVALIPLPKIIIDGQEEAEASQYNVMNYTCAVAPGVCRYCS